MAERDRDAALRRYREHRDTAAQAHEAAELDRTMMRLDEEEREARASKQIVSTEEASPGLATSHS